MATEVNQNGRLTKYSKNVVGIAFVGIYVLINLPLIRILTLHDVDTIIAIIGHSPEQFLFLALLFPGAIFLTYKVVTVTTGLQDQYPEVCRTAFWQWLINKRLILVTSLLIGLGVSALNRVDTTLDFYQRIPADARTAAELNKQIIIALSRAHSPQARDTLLADQQFKQNLEMLRAIYLDPDNTDQLMGLFEFFELGAVGFTVALAMWMLYLNLKLLGFARQLDDPEYGELLTADIRKTIPYGVVLTIIYLFWPPLRSYNMFEIRQVIPYSSLNPVNIYGVVAVAAITMIWLHYSRLGKNLISTITAVLSFLASGALMGLAGFSPESLVDYVGSGMGAANLIFLVFILIIFYIFGAEIFRQVTGPSKLSAASGDED